MNFFERQRQVRRMSLRLVLLFVLAVIGIVIAIDLAVALAFNAFNGQPSDLVFLLVVTSLIVTASVALASLVRTAALRGGGARVARELGGEFVPADTTDPQLRRLRNVVEEMAIAAGVTVPEIYVLADETAINAFAAGWSTSDAAVAVTRGALERLNRDELQGVIAHEFSHVVNGDMRLNIRLIGLLFGILIKAHLFTPVVVATTFIVGGLIIIWAERRQQSEVRVATVDDMTPWDALKVGLVQCFALVPGTSRSGATIIGGMLLGLSRRAATDYSFYLAMPTLIGAGAYSLYKERALLTMADMPVFGVGLVFSFLSAWVCVHWLLRYISSHDFMPFAWYRIAFGIVVLVTAWTGWVSWVH